MLFFLATKCISPVEFYGDPISIHFPTSLCNIQLLLVDISDLQISFGRLLLLNGYL